MNMREALSQPGFSPAEQQVIDYIVKEPAKAAGLTVRELAAEVFVSPATVLRVVRKCRRPGWREFSADLLLYAESAKQQSVSVNMSRPFGSQGSNAAIVSSLKSLFDQTIARTAALIRLEQVEKAASLLAGANRIFVFALGDSSLTARSFMNKLVKVDIHPILATEYGQQIEEAHNMKAGDVALFVSYHGQSESLARCAAILKQKDVPCIHVSKDQESPLKKCADCTCQSRRWKAAGGSPTSTPRSGWNLCWTSCFPSFTTRTTAGLNIINP